eukprot:SAG31_NODE_2701_length_5215_cov_286.244536_3_plen_298_part_00
MDRILRSTAATRAAALLQLVATGSRRSPHSPPGPASSLSTRTGVQFRYRLLHCGIRGWWQSSSADCGGWFACANHASRYRVVGRLRAFMVYGSASHGGLLARLLPLILIMATGDTFRPVWCGEGDQKTDIDYEQRYALLSRLKVSELVERAGRMGIDNKKIERAMDAENIKSAFVQLLVSTERSVMSVSTANPVSMATKSLQVEGQTSQRHILRHKIVCPSRQILVPPGLCEDESIESEVSGSTTPSRQFSYIESVPIYSKHLSNSMKKTLLPWLREYIIERHLVQFILCSFSRKLR